MRGIDILLVLPDLPTIFLSRLVLGIAVALIMTAQTALVGDYFSGEDRNALTGLQISARNFGGLVFISLAGWAATLSPRLPFAIYGLAARHPAVVACELGTLRGLPFEDTPAGPSIVVCAASLFLLSLALPRRTA